MLQTRVLESLRHLLMAIYHQLKRPEETGDLEVVVRGAEGRVAGGQATNRAGGMDGDLHRAGGSREVAASGDRGRMEEAEVQESGG